MHARSKVSPQQKKKLGHKWNNFCLLPESIDSLLKWVCYSKQQLDLVLTHSWVISHFHNFAVQKKDPNTKHQVARCKSQRARFNNKKLTPVKHKQQKQAEEIPRTKE